MSISKKGKMASLPGASLSADKYFSIDWIYFILHPAVYTVGPDDFLHCFARAEIPISAQQAQRGAGFFFPSVFQRNSVAPPGFPARYPLFRLPVLYPADLSDIVHKALVIAVLFILLLPGEGRPGMAALTNR